MKRGIIAALMVLFTSNVFAMPVGVPNKLKSLSSMTDFSTGDIEFYQGLEVDTLSRDMDKYNGEFNSSFIKAKIDMTVADNYDVYLTLGRGNNTEYEEGASSSRYLYDLEDDFSFSLGMNAIIAEIEEHDLTVYAGISYFNYTGVQFDNTYTHQDHQHTWMSGVSVTGDYTEWQLALGLAKQVQFALANFDAIWVPYAGFKFSDVNFDINARFGNASSSASLNSDNNFGIFLGSSLTLNENVSLNLETRLGDEQAVTFGFQVKL